MADKSLVEYIKKKINAGAVKGEPDDLLQNFELIKQLSQEVDYLKKDVEESEMTCQVVFSDAKEKYWIKISKGTIEYAKGKIKKPSITITTSKEVGLGMFLGEVDANIVAPLGKVVVSGKFTLMRDFQELYEDSIEEFKKRY